MFKKEAVDQMALLDNSPDGFDPNFSKLIHDQLMQMGEEYQVQTFDIISPTVSESEEYRLMGQDETTMDVALYTAPAQPYQPSSPRGPPERRVFAGELDFQVEINGSDTHRMKYLFSHKLNRIYVNMKTDFPVTFTWNGQRAPRPLYVRATVVFSDHSQAEKRVERCTQHTHELSNNGLDQTIVKNVLHSSRELNAQGVFYCGQPSQADSWFSVVVELPLVGPATHAYQFTCKNSCSNGINRRPIDIIFTLEDSNGVAVGRQTVGARVCSCPRRDKNCDESRDNSTGGKRRVQPDTNTTRAVEPKRKVPKIEVEDTIVMPLPPLQVVGLRTVTTGLEVMLSMMEQAASLQRNDPQALEPYTNCIQTLRKFIDDCKKQ